MLSPRSVLRPLLLLCLLAVILTARPVSDRTVSAQDNGGTAPPQLDYERVDEWTEQPWQRQAGFFTSWHDITATPDGRRYALDHLRGELQRLSPDGTTWERLALPQVVEDERGAQQRPHYSRIDAGPDGSLGVLGWWTNPRAGAEGEPEHPRTYIVIQPDDQGIWHPTHRVGLGGDRSYVDLAMGPAGLAYLARYTADDTAPQGSIDVIAPLDGPRAGSVTRIAPPELGHPYAVDVLADGTLYVLGKRCNCSPAPPPPPRTPSPTRTPAPSIAGAEPRAAALAQDGDGVLGLVVVGPDGSTRDTWSVGQASDVAVSSAGAVLIFSSTIYDIATRRAIYSAQLQFASGYHFERVDLRHDGVVTVANHSSGYNGFFEIDLARPERATPRGYTDAPALAGPYWPRALAFDADRDQLYVVDQQVRIGPQHHALGGPHHGNLLPASLQRWQRNGELVAQSGILWAVGSSQEHPEDVTALDGTMISISNRQLFARPDHSLPTWIRSFPGVDASGRDTLLAAVDADGPRIAVLDVGRERILWIDGDGQLLHEWSTWSSAPNALPADVAVHGERVYLADRGRNRIMVRDTDGGDHGEWPTHDGPLRITAGPRGDLFVLGRGGWLLRYSPQGSLVSWWRLPLREVGGIRRAVTPGDLDVDEEGRVYVSWWVEGPKDTIVAGQSGITVFAPVLRPAPEGRRPLQPGACLVDADKRAGPARVPLGATVEVTLTLRGECPGTHRPSQIAIVFDRSRSIEWNGALLRAQDALVDLLDTLNGEAVEIALVSFADGAALEVPLTDRLGEIRGRIATLDAGGDTRMAAGIDLARTELLGPRRDPNAEPHIWVVSDGVFKDQPTAAVEAAVAEGIIVDALIFRTHEFDNEVRDALRGLVGGAHLHEELRPERERHIVEQITAYDPQRGLFDTVTIDDEIPANMRVVEGSIDPPAQRLDPDSAILRWAHRDVLAADALTLTYRLEPLELGVHPTNVEADARWTDAWGHTGRLGFPVPRVEVYAPPTPTPTPEPDPVIYLPFASRYRCHRRAPLDIVLTVDTSGSMGRPVVGQPGTALDVARQGMRDFVRLLDLPRDRVAVVEFNAAARVVAGLSGDRARISAAIDDLRHAPGSRLDQGLALAAHALDSGAAPHGRPVVILLTDGQQYDGRKLALAWGDGMRGRGVTVWAVGFGPTVDEELLRRLASTPDRYHRSIGAQDLLPIYGRIGAELACPGR